MSTIIMEVLGVSDVVALTPFSESFIRKEIRDGRLPARKAGTRVIITRRDLEKYLNTLPARTSGEAPIAANAARRTAK